MRLYLQIYSFVFSSFAFLSCSSPPSRSTPAQTPLEEAPLEEAEHTGVDNPLYSAHEQPDYAQILLIPTQSVCTHDPLTLGSVFPIGEVLSGLEVRKFVEKRDDAESRVITRGVRVVSGPKPVHWCGESAAQGESLEAVARRVVQTLHASYAFYKQLPSALPPAQLAPLNIQLFPKEVRFAREKDERWSKRILKDKTEWGLGLGPKGEKRFELVIAPQSVAAVQNQSPYLGRFVGDVPLILYHEFAHHLFYHHLQKILDGMMEMPKDELRLKLPFVPKDLHNSTEISRVLYALNEGFADLMAFYMAEEQESDIHSMPELQKTREINSAFLATGRPKVIGYEEFAQEILSPSPHDAHWLGAILAHGIHRVLSLGNPSPEAKAEMLLVWLKELNDTFTFGYWGGVSYLQNVLHRLVSVKLKFSNLPEKDITDTVREVFPVLDGYLPSSFPSV